MLLMSPLPGISKLLFAVFLGLRAQNNNNFIKLRFYKSTSSCCRYLFRPYSKHVCSGVNVIWALFIVIGVSSAYFHATLSLVGQLLDELAILWGLMVAFALWTPKWMLAHGPFGEDRYKYQDALLYA